MSWSSRTLGDWTGRRVVITGANSGIGLAAAKVLVEHGAGVVLACRDAGRGASAAASLAGPGSARAATLDLADQDSVRSYAEAELASDDGPIHALVNNAGVMACPLASTPQGIELQMGTNHFGHALLTSLLLPRIDPAGRVVVISSIAARGGNLTGAMTAEDLTAPVPYSRQQVYSNTKQANLLYAQELHRRLRAAGNGIAAIAAHPGVSATALFTKQLQSNNQGWLVPLARPALSVFVQSAAAGAEPTLRALEDPSLSGGEFVGPRHLGQSRGRPEILSVYRQGADEAAAARLFDLTEEILGISLLGGLSPDAPGTSD